MSDWETCDACGDAEVRSASAFFRMSETGEILTLTLCSHHTQEHGEELSMLGWVKHQDA